MGRTYVPNIVNAGVAVIERKILALIPPGQHLDLATDIFSSAGPRWAARQGRVAKGALGDTTFLSYVSA
jgi:hypothetical protein